MQKACCAAGLHEPFPRSVHKTFSITEKIIPNDSIAFWDPPNAFVLLVCCIAKEHVAVCGFRWPGNNALFPYLVAAVPYLVSWAAGAALLPKTQQCICH